MDEVSSGDDESACDDLKYVVEAKNFEQVVGLAIFHVKWSDLHDKQEVADEQQGQRIRRTHEWK